MPRIIVLDNLSQDGLDLLDSAGDIEYEVRTGLGGEELRQALLEFDGAICRSGVKITAESLEGNHRLRAIARAGVGTDNIDKEAATRHGIVVMNTPGGNTISTAEHAIALMLGLSRNVHPAYAMCARGVVKLAGRQMLHAVELVLKHPTTGETLNFSAELPLDFRAALDLLRRNH